MNPPLLRRHLLVIVVATFIAPMMAANTPKKLLVVTVTTSFRHSSIPTAEKVLADLAQETGEFTVDFVRQPAGAPPSQLAPRPGPKGPNDPAYQQALAKYNVAKAAFDQWMPAVVESLKALSPANLAHYDGVIFVSTTGDLPLPDKAGFLKWIADGHAFIGMHAASDTFHGYPAFFEMLGGEFSHHGPQVAVDCLNQDPDHPATKPLPATWAVYDEIYQFKDFNRSGVHMLLALDRHPNDKTPGFFPVSWCKRYGTGRVFYTSLGHREDVWDPAATVDGQRKNPPDVARLYQQHILGGIRWALGLTPGADAPQSSGTK